MVEGGAKAELIGTITRDDGYVQVTYNKMPLYYWFKDVKPGDTNGQNVGKVWFVPSAAGEAITAATLPRTGGLPLTAILLAGGTLLAGLFALRRRFAR